MYTYNNEVHTTLLLIINVCNDTNDPHNNGLAATSSFQLKDKFINTIC